MIDQDHPDGRSGSETSPPSSSLSDSGRRSHGALLPGLLVIAVLLGGVVALDPDNSFRTIRRLAGFDNDRLGVAPTVSQGVGTYAFMRTQRGSDVPVAFTPCRPIEVVVNPDGAPANYDELVDTGLARTGAATGLKFVRVGLTDDRGTPRGGLARRRPVLIAWATPEEFPELAGAVAGIGGSTAVGTPGRLRYVTGQVILDRDLFASFGPRDAEYAQAIVDHELGHVVGLDHVDDPGELMYEYTERTTYGPGDREGLAKLGSVDC
ncbi:matrixin family metalloprotease [Nocardioides sp. GY 10113]|uniref:matrixin family metalloprotease n=1 Tax=Nocardioides sp. GY 10113 TaxID=2569761 RepID=UPI0010A8558B|nr:matrixin family metalloprotease [Nocardioides sp. GY 10113]TIC82209.1 matrixin family metalloprotease [Nocardioides sp. GY 10113]